MACTSASLFLFPVMKLRSFGAMVKCVDWSNGLSAFEGEAKSNKGRYTGMVQGKEVGHKVAHKCASVSIGDVTLAETPAPP